MYPVVLVREVITVSVWWMKAYINQSLTGPLTLSSASFSMFIALLLTFLSSLVVVSSSFFRRWPASRGLLVLKSYGVLGWPKNWRSEWIQSCSCSIRATWNNTTPGSGSFTGKHTAHTCVPVAEAPYLISSFLTLLAVLADVVLQFLDLELNFVVLLSDFISCWTLIL